MEYPKINSLWKREGWYFDQGKKKSREYQKGRQSFIIGDYAREEFGNIKKWKIDEKIDGTNVRIHFKQVDNYRIKPSIYGRTGFSVVQENLLPCLENIATWENCDRLLEKTNQSYEVWLFGEGYGPKIQAAGEKYCANPGFILFDVCINGKWLPRDAVKEIAEKLSLPVVPEIGIFSESEIVEYVKSKPLSKCSIEQQVIEGIVARAHPMVLFPNGDQVVWKLKCKEF